MASDGLANNQSPGVSVALYVAVGNISCGLCIFIVVASLRLVGSFGCLAFDCRLVSSEFVNYFWLISYLCQAAM